MPRIFAFAVSMGVLSVLAGCTGREKNQTESSVIPVTVSTVGYSQNETSREYIGIAEEEFSAVISFPVSGTLEKMYAREGERVQQGMLLAELTTQSLASAYSAAKAQLDQAEDAMQRIQMLYDSNSLAEIKYIEMKTDLEKARSMETISKKNLEDSRLSAPFSGIIGKKQVETGENVLPHQPVFTLLKTDRIHIRVPVPEKEINAVQLNNPAWISVGALGDACFDGIVVEKGVAADRMSHTYDILIRVQMAGTELLPGMVAKVVLPADPDGQTLCVPVNTVQSAANGEKYVWCIREGMPVKQTVRTGGLAAGGVEILSGLQPGQEIVTEGYQNLREGVKIIIR